VTDNGGTGRVAISDRLGQLGIVFGFVDGVDCGAAVSIRTTEMASDTHP